MFDSITHLQNTFDEPMIVFLRKMNSFSKLGFNSVALVAEC